ncbi:tetratricopeptide repeat protein [Candidatus Latescibacterota bacterium]
MEKGRQHLKRFSRLSEQDKKIRNFRIGLLNHPNDPTLYYALGVVFGERGELAAAMRKYEQAIAADSGFVRAYNNLGNALLRSRQVDRALDTFRRAIAIDSTYALAHNGLGNALLVHGDPQGAVEAYRRAADLDEGSTEFQRNLEVAEQVAATGAPREQ